MRTQNHTEIQTNNAPATMLGEAALWAHNPIFAAAGQATCQELARRFPAEQLEEGATVVAEGQPMNRLCVLLSGTVRTQCSGSDTAPAITRLLRAPALLGEVEAIHGLPASETAMALEPVQVAWIPMAAYLELAREAPRTLMEHLRHLAAAAQFAKRNERQVAALMEHRLAKLVLSHAELFGSRTEDGELVLRCRLSVGELASTLGAARRSVTRLLSNWRKQRLLDHVDGEFVVTDPQGLEQLARLCPGGLNYRMQDGLSQNEPEAAPLPQGQLTVVRGNRRLLGLVVTVDDELLVGRDGYCGLQLPDDTVSPRHCRVFRPKGDTRYWIEDLESLNGTRINGKPIGHRAVLRPGDEIQLGYTRLTYSMASLPPASEPAEQGPRTIWTA